MARKKHKSKSGGKASTASGGGRASSGGGRANGKASYMSCSSCAAPKAPPMECRFGESSMRWPQGPTDGM